MKYKYSFLILVCIIFSCTENNDGFYFDENSKEKVSSWNEYLQSIGHAEITTPTVLLVVRTVDCKKYFNEIQWWINELESESIGLSVIIAEKYESYFDITVNNFDLKSIAYQDSSFAVLNAGLVQSLPLKIYINPVNDDLIGARMGKQHILDRFLEKSDLGL